jgi:ribosomal protein S18 acetylase RimI-like enzyme
MLTSLGSSGVERYYRFVIASPAERVWVAVTADVIGGCVLSDAPGSVMSRFARHAPLALASELGKAVVREPAFRRRIVKRIREHGDEPHAPEVTQIFTDASLRGQGIGASLLRTCEASLRDAGAQKYFVHTERDDNEAGIRFYRREGFVTIAESQSFGQAFLVMQKDLA